ncbi:radical SAM protein [Ruminococcaceae bacterium OttesenSCG-928-A11]|nr:radical SAM protein [Ruminococcaceae bacterium OttesenSCG-928-A11]
MLKPASALCNLRCRYCFYADVSSLRGVPNYGIMSGETAHDVIGNIYRDLEDGDEITLAFQGGEPTLAGLDFFKGFVAGVERQPVRARVNWALQTNGVLLDRDWCAFLREKHFLVGLSLDGDAAQHNANRVDGHGQGSFAQVMAAKRLLEAAGVDYNVLCGKIDVYNLFLFPGAWGLPRFGRLFRLRGRGFLFGRGLFCGGFGCFSRFFRFGGLFGLRLLIRFWGPAPTRRLFFGGFALRCGGLRLLFILPSLYGLLCRRLFARHNLIDFIERHNDLAGGGGFICGQVRGGGFANRHRLTDGRGLFFRGRIICRHGFYIVRLVWLVFRHTAFYLLLIFCTKKGPD